MNLTAVTVSTPVCSMMGVMPTVTVIIYSQQTIIDVLHGKTGSRTIRFRYTLLDKNNVTQGDITNLVLNARVSNNFLAEIKRTAVFELRDDGSINFLSDRIKPFCEVKMSDGGWVSFPLGVFLLSTPEKRADVTGLVTRRIEGYDQNQVLKDDRVTDRYLIPAGTNTISAVKTILDGAGINNQNLTPTNKTLPVDREWDPGTTKLQIVNELLASINYLSLYFDEDGVAVAKPYVSPANRAVEYTYRDDDTSVLFPEMEQVIDLFNVPNQWVLIVSEPDRSVLKSIYTNSNPDSPTSTVSRGRTIVDYRQVEAADQTTLDDLAARLAFEASQVYEHVRLETPIMPFHSHNDVIQLYYAKLGIAFKYSEQSWSFELRPGARHQHDIRRVVVSTTDP